MSGPAASAAAAAGGDPALHVLERLLATDPDCEVWFDSSPLVYPKWKASVLASAPEGKRADWAEQLGRLFDRDAIAATGAMVFGGVTTNPPLSLGAIENDPAFWRGLIAERIAAEPGATVEALYWHTYLEVVRLGSAEIRPVYERSGRRRGFLSGQVDPRFVTDRARMLAQGLELAAIADNVMVKIPGSKEGYEVIEELTARGIPTNNTTSFTVAQYVACMEAVSRGLDRARANGVDLGRWRSVITHMSSRLGNVGDLAAEAKERGIALTPEEVVLGELAVLKRAYRYGKERGHPSKMLQCSMRVTKGPDGRARSWHVEKLAGGDFVYTCPPGYIAQLMEAEDDLVFRPSAVDEDASPELIGKLRRLPYFRKAYDFDGMAPEEFSTFGAFVATATEFAAATRKTVDFVARAVEATRQRAA